MARHSGHDWADLSELRVVFVEDDDDARALAAEVLRECGAEVAEARTAAEALALIRAWMPDVLVSDLGLPGDDGIELIRRVRALPADQGGNVPAIALTGRTAVEDACDALGAGFQVHVAKPIDASLLTDAVANVAGMHVVPRAARRSSLPRGPVAAGVPVAGRTPGDRAPGMS